MARPLPVNMLLAGTGAVLLVSGIGGKSIGEVLKGSFGNLEVKRPAIGSEPEQAAGGASGVSVGGGQFGASPVSFGSATIAPPPPPSIGRHGSVPPPSEALYWNRKRELEKFLKRPLTARENTEIKDLERKGEL